MLGGQLGRRAGLELIMDGSELLHEAGALVTAGWCQGATARDPAGNSTDVRASGASSWSLLGALQAATLRDSSTQVDDVALAVAAIAELIDDPSLSHWNDAAARTQLEVVQLLDRAEVKALAQLIYHESVSLN